MAKINYEHLLAVFAVLYTSQSPLTTQQVSDQSGLSASPSLKSLNGFGFVDKTKQGRQVAWSLTESARRTGRQALERLRQQE